MRIERAKIIHFIGLCFLCLLQGAAFGKDPELPSPSREFRAAWVTTFHNYDWPSRPGLTVREMKREVHVILDRVEELNMNTVIFQVRPQADALYRSNFEPWSFYLTGVQGKAPQGNFDPLKFWIDAAHSRGMQLHAWFNPYRAFHGQFHGKISPDSVHKQRPELVVKLKKTGYWWLIPTLEEARKYTTDVVMDVVKNYDVDGIHFDDYFYPYPDYNQNKPFPDSQSYQKYQKSGGYLDRDDWRRDAVNQLLRELYRKIKGEKPYVEFGISPFGIYRPGYPEGVTGLDQYSVLYADARLWLRGGYLDYMTPQLYWPINAQKQSFPKLLEWWQDQNFENRHLWPGIKLDKTPTEIENQIKLVRKLARMDPGMAMFSISDLMSEKSQTAKALQQGVWSELALVPESAWLKSAQPGPPKLNFYSNPTGYPILHIHLQDDAPFQLVINEKRNGEWTEASIRSSRYQSHSIAEGVTEVAVRTVNRHRRMSRPAIVKVDGGDAESR